MLSCRRIAAYHRLGGEAEVVETVAGKTRTTTTSYDGAGRSAGKLVASDEGMALPEVTTTYDAANGKTAQTNMGGASIAREYDLLGRLVKHVDADGSATSTEFDRFGKEVKVSDPTGSRKLGKFHKKLNITSQSVR